MEIYDCFIFFNELDLLEIRLNELYDSVDYFVLVEATKTHAGEEKPLYFNENKKRFSKWKDKIIHIIVEDMPKVGRSYGKNWKVNSILKGGRWKLEAYQKNQIKRGLKGCKDEDIILLSDLDEIPNKEKFPEMIKKLDSEKVVFFNQKLYYYFLNGYVEPNWIGTRACRFKTFRKGFGQNIDRFRRLWNVKLRLEMKFGKKIYTINEGGWHFSYLGGIDLIIKKISAHCHVENNISDFKDPKKIKERILNGEDLFGRNSKITYVKIDKTFPKTIYSNQKKYGKYLMLQKNRVKTQAKRVKEI